MCRYPCDVSGISRRIGFSWHKCYRICLVLDMSVHDHILGRHSLNIAFWMLFLDVEIVCLFFFVGCVRSFFSSFLAILFIETSWLSKSDSESWTWISLRPAVSAVASLSASNFLTASSVASILRAWVTRALGSCSLSSTSSLMLLVISKISQKPYGY